MDEGRPVRVAVIDSGVHPGHPHIAAIAGGVGITADGALDTDPSAWIDRIGHGTAVMAAIQEKAPAARCFAVRVFHESLRTSARSLIRALDWCVDAGIDIANLSLGTANALHAPAFEDAVARAGAHGVLVIAAIEAGGAPSYPGCLPGVVGVAADWACPRDSFHVTTREGRAVFSASGYPRPIAGVPPQKNLHGVSFAVANMTGLVARDFAALSALDWPGRLRMLASGQVS